MRIKVDHIAANARHKFQFPEMNNNVKPDTLLSSGVGAGTLRVNSRHHQGIKALGKNLRVNAIAPDGLIEGIELPDHPFVLGVQWHPESLSDRYPDHQRLFDAFIHACADHRQPV